MKTYSIDLGEGNFPHFVRQTSVNPILIEVGHIDDGAEIVAFTSRPVSREHCPEAPLTEETLRALAHLVMRSGDWGAVDDVIAALDGHA